MIWVRCRKICNENFIREPKSRHKLKARTSMVLHEILTKKKCNWNVHVAACSCTNGPVMDLFGKGSKEYASKALMGNQKIGTSWMQGLQWYSMRNSPNRNVIEMFHVCPMFMQKWPVMDLFGKGFKKICIKSSNREPKNWHKLNARSSMVLHEKLTKKKCNWNVSCGRMFMHKWPVMDLFGKGSKNMHQKL